MLKGLPRGIDSFMGCDGSDLDVEMDQRLNVLGFFLYGSFFWYVAMSLLLNHRLSG